MPTKTLNSGGTIDFDFIGIGNVILRQRLRVPPNQREYSWEEKQVNELFQDLASAISKNKPSYFLGTIVLTGGKDEPIKEVADGQQRLATTTILLAAIRDFFLKKKQPARARYIDSFLSSIVLETAEMEPRLVLNVDDNIFFRDAILPAPDDPGRTATSPKRFSHERLAMAHKKAAEHIKRILKPYAESAQIDTLNQWVKYIEQSAQVIVLTVPDDLNAFVMFETLNDRGLKTSQADLLKNYLFSEATEERINEAQQKWSKMVGALETLETSDITMTYLRHLASALYGATREREVFEKIKAKVSGRTNSIAFLETLADYADDYVAIMNPSDPKWAKYGLSMRRSISTLSLLAVEQIRPLMLAVAHHYKPKDAVSAFRLFVSWVVRIMIFGGGRGGTLDAAYSELAQKVCEGTFTNVKELAKAMENIVPTDVQFQAEFATARVSKSHLARYYLRALELANRGEKEPEFVPNEDQSEITLEHILPENPEGKWGIKPEIAAAYYKRLGNLVLLKATLNSDFGNEPFSVKKPVLEKSTYKLTEMIKAATSWGPDEIDARQKKLAEIAVKTWPLRA